MTDKEERIEIISKGWRPQDELKFFKDVQEAILEGYRIADTGLRKDQCLRNFRGNAGKAVLYLEGCEPDRFEPTVAPKVESEPVEDLKETPTEDELSSGAAENKPVEPEVVEPTRDELLAEAEAIGAEIDKRWGDKRLLKEIQKKKESIV